MALWSVAANVSPLLVLDLTVVGRTVEKAVVSLFIVLVIVVPAWPIGSAMSSTLPQYLLRVVTEEIFIVKNKSEKLSTYQ